MKAAQLKTSQIHIYSVCLKALISDLNYVDTFWQLLSQKEKERSQKLINQNLKNKFIITRGILRKILASYLNHDAKNIEFTYNKNGKPKLTENLFADNIFFNISHSKDFAIYGFSKDSELGIDIEYVRKEFALFVNRLFVKMTKKVIDFVNATVERMRSLPNILISMFAKKERKDSTKKR